MTRADLIAENEALHGLLAHACEALVPFGALASACDTFGAWSEEEWGNLRSGVMRDARKARDVLDQIREGVVP